MTETKAIDLMAECREDHFSALRTRTFFRSMVGATLSCPVCSDILDYRRAINLETLDGVTKGDHIICRKCTPKTMRSLAARGITYRIGIDGKALEAICRKRKTIPPSPAVTDGLKPTLPDGGICRLPVDGLRAMLLLASTDPVRYQMCTVRYFYCGKKGLHYLTATDGKVLGSESWLDNVGSDDVGPFFIPVGISCRKSAKVILLRVADGKPTIDIDGKVTELPDIGNYPDTFPILSDAAHEVHKLAHDTILGVQTIGKVAAAWAERPNSDRDPADPSIHQTKKDGPVVYSGMVSKEGMRVRLVLAMPVVREDGPRAEAADTLASRLGK